MKPAIITSKKAQKDLLDIKQKHVDLLQRISLHKTRVSQLKQLQAQEANTKAQLASQQQEKQREYDLKVRSVLKT